MLSIHYFFCLPRQREEIDISENVKAKDLKLWKVEIPDDHNDQLRNLLLQDKDELLATKKISKYFPFILPEDLEEALSCIPPPIMILQVSLSLKMKYSPKCTTLKATTRANSDPPTKFFQNKVVFYEENVRIAIDSNICMILNWLMVPGYNFSKHQIYTSGIPDFNCYLLELLILVFEVKRKHVLEDIGDQIFPEFYWANKKARTVIQQIYNYMGVNKLKYGILNTYDDHWFLC
ncbi:hypothetical protein RhiirA4_481792 [Rhizophagus irregularis]|uniref:Uncharacterized protein n=1 Tax=Rhizophagus irregularis TaxID=588596 RepID=A0A2I1HK06_9GLOM|nr:hypothetical protein RhiirA4_481792 [Rhizophagus irregularis]